MTEVTTLGIGELGVLVTLIVVIVGGGRWVGSVDQRGKRNSTDIEEIKKIFRDSDGEPRLVSYSSLRHIRDDCQARILGEVSHIRNLAEKTSQGQAELSRDVQEVLRQHAVLMSKKKGE